MYFFCHFLYLWRLKFCCCCWCLFWEKLTVKHVSRWRWYNRTSVSIIYWALLSLYHSFTFFTISGIDIPVVLWIIGRLSSKLGEEILSRRSIVILIFLMLFLIILRDLAKWIISCTLIMRIKLIILLIFYGLVWWIVELEWIVGSLFLKIHLSDLLRRILWLYFGWFGRFRWWWWSSPGLGLSFIILVLYICGMLI